MTFGRLQNRVAVPYGVNPDQTIGEKNGSVSGRKDNQIRPLNTTRIRPERFNLVFLLILNSIYKYLQNGSESDLFQNIDQDPTKTPGAGWIRNPFQNGR